MDYDAIVVGCGHNGLVAGFYLAKSGLRVLALERGEKVGGLASTDELIPGFHFTTYGHSFVMFHTEILNDMRLFDYGLQINSYDPGSFQPFRSGKHLLYWSDYERTIESIAQISPKDAEAWPLWLEYHARMGAMFEPYLLTEPPTLGEMARRFEGTPDEELFNRMITGTIRGFLDDLFESEEMKASVIATFDSGSTDAPGAMLYWAFHSAASAGLAAQGLNGYPKGGMGAVAKALGESAADAGLEVRTNAEVDKIMVRDGQAVGVRLANGDEISARVVLSNADPQRTLLGLVGREELDAEFVTRMERVHSVAGYFKLHCACSGLPDWSALPGDTLLPQHYAQTRILHSIDTLDEAWYAARRGQIPEECSLGIISPTVHDPDSAPPGHYCISIWGEFAPTRLREGTWDEMGKVAADRLIGQVAEVAPNFPDIVEDWYLITPESMVDRFGMTVGHMHHTDMTLDQMLSQRSAPGMSGYETPVRGLYLGGSGCHPGGGVTGLPGRNSAMAALKHLGQL